MKIYIINWFNNGDFIMTDGECFKNYEAAKLEAEHQARTQLSNGQENYYDIVEVDLNN